MDKVFVDLHLALGLGECARMCFQTPMNLCISISLSINLELGANIERERGRQKEKKKTAMHHHGQVIGTVQCCV